jgi:hypothetical protein
VLTVTTQKHTKEEADLAEAASEQIRTAGGDMHEGAFFAERQPARDAEGQAKGLDEEGPAA